MMWRFTCVAFLIAHGLVHIAVWGPTYEKGKASTHRSPGCSVG